MTAIKPIENRRVTAVSAERYALNQVCAHPECSEPAVDPHHAFPRSAIGGDSWFVTVVFDSFEDAQAVLGKEPAVTEIPAGPPQGTAWASDPIPHVVGLCRKHHDEAENHDAWIKLEGGVWNWLVYEPNLWNWLVYEPNLDTTPEGEERDKGGAFITMDALNPQPGSREGRKKRKRLQGEERRKRKNVSIRVPDDVEDGGALWDEALERVKARLVQEELYEEGATIPNYEALMAALNDWLNS